MTEKLLKLVGPVHIFGGLLLFASAYSPSAINFLQSQITGSADLVWSTFFAAVLGPTIASWGVLFTALTNQFLATPTTTLWRSLMLSILIWAPLDTALCLKFDIYVGAVVNGGVVLIVGWLLLSVKKSIP